MIVIAVFNKFYIFMSISKFQNRSINLLSDSRLQLCKSVKSTLSPPLPTEKSVIESGFRKNMSSTIKRKYQNLPPPLMISAPSPPRNQVITRTSGDIVSTPAPPSIVTSPGIVPFSASSPASPFNTSLY